MRSVDFAASLLAIALALAFSACNSGSSSENVPGIAKPNGLNLPAVEGANVLPLSINGAACAGNNSYPNKPCVSVTICAPDSATNCQTVSDILLDTGSVGLRVFKSLLNPAIASALTPVTVDGKDAAACIQYGDGSSDWGPIMNAGVVLGGEPGVNVPVQVIDSTFATLPSSCPTPDVNPSTTGFNGILGVGFFLQDCGPGCETHANNDVYFSCTGTGAGAQCASVALPTTQQVQNVVASLPVDNNGVILELPDAPLGGAAALEGYLVLGIGTAANNAPSGVTAFGANPVGNFVTAFQGQDYTAFIDSGSNALFFPGAGMLPDCGQTNPGVNGVSGWFCPGKTATLAAITSGGAGSPSASVQFQVGNTVDLLSSPNHVFTELGHDGRFGSSQLFDWGLPFFIGRNVYVGYEGRSSSLGSGTYWAY